MTHHREPIGTLRTTALMYIFVHTLLILKYTVYTFARLLLIVDTTLCYEEDQQTVAPLPLSPVCPTSCFRTGQILKKDFKKKNLLFCRNFNYKTFLLVHCTVQWSHPSVDRKDSTELRKNFTGSRGTGKKSFICDLCVDRREVRGKWAIYP